MQLKTNVNGCLGHVIHLPFYQRLLAHFHLAGKRSSGNLHKYLLLKLGHIRAFMALEHISAKGAGFGADGKLIQ